MVKKQRTHRKPSEIFSWLTEKLFRRVAPNPESDKEEKQNFRRIPGPVYNFGCSSTAAGNIANELDRGGKYPSNNTDS
jgi:hypothetical protein